MTREQFQKTYGKIVAKAWTDEAFKQRLLSDPTMVLKENGVDVPEGVEFTVVQSTHNLVHLVLPPRPDAREMTAENLESRVEAMVWMTCWGF